MYVSVHMLSVYANGYLHNDFRYQEGTTYTNVLHMASCRALSSSTRGELYPQATALRLNSFELSLYLAPPLGMNSLFCCA